MEITLTPEQEAIVPDAQQYLESLANDRLARKVERTRSAKILTLSAQSDAELDAAIKPLVDAKVAAIEAEIIKEP